MPILGLSHIAICVSDLERSLAFYSRLGFRPLGRRRVENDAAIDRLLEIDHLDFELAFIELEGARVELIQFHHPIATEAARCAFNRIGLTHLSLKVTDFDATIRKLESEGVAVRRHTIGSHQASNSRFAFLTDPDGTRIELFGALDERATMPWDLIA